ncbi:MAG TPA: protein kinase [Terracidiphilus sp.]|nr:protein kinase [Terracidiphilus sp.]
MEDPPKGSLAGATATSRRQIGQYEVIGKLGAGGMGEVYRARDARLERDVALKILPASLAQDGHSLARLEREARTLAALNHPNIAVIYGLEEGEGLRALVMELVEGETLAEKIHGVTGRSARCLSAEEALPIAKQIAEALEYAHERGVIHRDLKPANVKITPEGTVKVLDFGLAKVLSDQDSVGPVSAANSPTLSVMATQAGIILGTAAYMAPEQAKGKQVDRRADIWAFGCVLFEMLAGKQPFEGETTSDLLAAVIRGEPEWTDLPEKTPPAIKRLIRRCLMKDPKQRLRDIGDARIAIEEVMSGAGLDADKSGASGIQQNAQASRVKRALPWALGCMAVLFAGLAGWLLLKPKPPANVIRFPVPPPQGTDFLFGGTLSISPDGHTLAFIAQDGPDKPGVLWLRPLDSMIAVQVAGTDGALGPTWSPDSQQIAFQANGKLEKVVVAGGAPQTLCDADFPGASWNKDGVILFSNHNNIYSVPDTGGEPTLVAAPDAAHGEFFQFPQFLPDGRHFIVQVRTGTAGADYIATGSLDSKTVERLTPSTTDALYAAPGFLLYMDQSTLMARPFNAKALRFTGGAVPVAQNVGIYSNVFYGFFTVSPAGILAYQTVPAVSTNQMTWFNRTGQKLGAVGQPDVYATPALSPDGTKLAVAVGILAKHNIWVYDLKRGTGSRLTADSSDDLNPVWSADGKQIMFSSNRAGQYDIYQEAANGLGSAEIVLQSKDHAKYLNDLTADGHYAVFDNGGDSNETALWALPMLGDHKPFAFLSGEIRAFSAQFSPNGHYVAYSSTETGRNEIYVQTFPQQTGKWQISASGGTDPMWRRDGKELFFLTPDQKLMAVDVNTGAGTFQAGIPKELFQTQTIPPWYWRNIYAPSADGQRFLMLTPASEAKPEPITVVVNWPATMSK